MSFAVTDPPGLAQVTNALQRMGDVWLKWCGLVQRAINWAPRLVGDVSLSGQSATIAATSIVTATLDSGLYQVDVQHRVTRADGVSSSLTPFISVTESALTVVYTGSANTSNSTTVGKTDTFNVLIDSATPVKYGLTMTSGGGGPAVQYRLSIKLFRLPSLS